MLKVEAESSGLIDRVKKVPQWDKLTPKKLSDAVTAQILSEVPVPSEAEVVRALHDAKDAEANIVYDLRTALLSVNQRPDRTAISCIIKEAAIVDGQVRERDTLLTLATVMAIRYAVASGNWSNVATMDLRRLSQERLWAIRESVRNADSSTASRPVLSPAAWPTHCEQSSVAASTCTDPPTT